jgi:hypothetical protein
MDFGVVVNNFGFLMVQGFLGFGNFVGGTLRLAIPAIVLGFILGIFIGLGGWPAPRGSGSPRRATWSSSAARPSSW